MIVRAALLALHVGLLSAGPSIAQGPSSRGAQPLILAVNEGAAGNVDATEIALRYEGFKATLQRALGAPVSLVAVRDVKVLRSSVRARSYSLILSRPVDVLAEAIRDFGYQPVVVAKETGYAFFIVPKDSPIRSIMQVDGKTLVTPDRYSYMWRIAAAMLRDNQIAIAKQNVRSMRDQAAIGWSVENGFFDVGVVASFSAVGRTWEKKGGRVIARSRDLVTVPLVASPRISTAQIERLRAVLIKMDSNEEGAAILKQIGVGGFRETSPGPFLDLLAWLGDLEAPKE
ncbi:MAG TPA: PhnD/SsuA/transferrin family substrate-binding protein [Burkholderiales bacterium]|nr:PhnD/SsuA/transferrin family substrate-binding protein [Burkholderiales bacterium]